MPPKNEQRFSSLQQQEQAIQDFLDNISDDEETPFDNDVSFEASDDEDKIPAVSEGESEGEEGDEEYKQLPRKQLFKTLDECCNETNHQHLKVQDKENKLYTYTSAEKKFTWEWHTQKERGVSGRAANQNILRGAEGPRGRAKAAKTPVEGLKLFITDEMMQDVVNNTNKNIQNFMTRFHDVLKESSKYTYVKKTDLIELKAWIGLLYLRATLQLNIFKTRETFFHESTHEIFAATMSYNHFAFLIRFVEFDDKETWQQRWREDKFDAIHEFFMKMNESNGRCCNPSPYVSVDETLYPYRGRIGMKQYNPSKPAKYGLLYRVSKMLGIEQSIERRQKPELLNKGQRCYLCLEEISGQPDCKANKDKLNNKVKTVCISCKNTTCIKQFITTCDRCFEGTNERFYFLIFLHVVYSEKNANCL